MTGRSTHRPLTVGALLLCMFMTAMEATVVATAMPTVVADLGGIELYGWVGAIYMLACTVTMPLYGKLADLQGRKPVLYAGMALFLAGSVASGLSATLEQLIAFRAIQGLGAGALQPIALTVVGDLYSAGERARVQSLFGAIWGFAGIAGPLLGGVIVHVLSWHWVFFVNVPFGVLAALLLMVAYHEQAPKTEQRLDWLGALVLSAGIIALLLAASRVVPLLTAPAAAALLLLFVVVERRAPAALLPLPLFRQPVIAAASAAGAVLGSTMMASLTYVPLLIQGVLRGSPAQAGSAITPMLIGWPLAAALSGRLIGRIGYRPMVRAGAVTALVGVATLAIYFDRLQNLFALRMVMGCLGVGLGLANTALIIAVQESVGWEQRGVATATTLFFRTIGGAVSVGALGALLGASLADRIPDRLLDQLLMPLRDGSPRAAVSAEAASILGAGLEHVFWATAIVAALGTLVAFAFPKDVRARAAG
jgi:EmrB/QacA subfamily drug resistance transporter